MNEKIEYIKDDEVVLINEDGLFVYETNVFVYYPKLFGLANSSIHTSTKPIEGIVKSFWKSPYIQICSSLYSAPERWLIDNQYKRYIETKKVSKKKSSKNKK